MLGRLFVCWRAHLRAVTRSAIQSATHLTGLTTMLVIARAYRGCVGAPWILLTHGTRLRCRRYADALVDIGNHVMRAVSDIFCACSASTRGTRKHSVERRRCNVDWNRVLPSQRARSVQGRLPGIALAERVIQARRQQRAGKIIFGKTRDMTDDCARAAEIAFLEQRVC